MIYTKPTSTDNSLPHSVVKINGCSNSNVEFTLLDAVPTVGKRRYCNKVLVHECVTVPEGAPLDLSGAEFLATSDSCYKLFEFYKSSELYNDIEPTVTLQLNEENLTTSILVQFYGDETCCLPVRLAYRLYGYLTDTDERILLSNGSLYISPCICDEGSGNEPWADVTW